MGIFICACLCSACSYGNLTDQKASEDVAPATAKDITIEVPDKEPSADEENDEPLPEDEQNGPSDTKIHFLTLPGYMDAILLESNGKFGMIDSGEDSDYPDGSDPGYPSRPGTITTSGQEERVISYLYSVGVNTENFVFYIGTHAHSDHIGSADEVIREFQPERVYLMRYSDSVISSPGALYDNLYIYDTAKQAAADVGATFIEALDPSLPQGTYTDTGDGIVGSTIFSMGDMEFEFYNYDGPWLHGTQVSDANDMSLGVLITAYGHSAFVGGDMTTDREALIAEQVGDVDILKAGHHGTELASCSEFVSALRPDITVITGSEAKYLYNQLDSIFPGRIGFDKKIYATNWYSDMEQAIVLDMSTLQSNLQNTDPVFVCLDDMVYALMQDGLCYTSTQVFYYNGNGYIYDNSPYASYNAWAYIDHAWFYAGPDVTMITGWQVIGGETYYFGDDGRMLTGDQTINGTAYHFDPDTGELLDRCKPGWYRSGDNWYYYNYEGKMTAGWQQINGSWYYMDGAGIMQTGWLWDGSGWYFLSSSGYMLTGLQEIDGETYYLGESGEMQIGLQEIDGEYYYFNGDGELSAPPQ
ncbi:hypothetical protein LKD70_03810 [Ruminococcus sp. CLA-AA-H200]|uniref:MBL fold metallo-hydrolase n=1 Tax=Ruminococcus turbiniformis TaxID=2881258 RepID=A0ABS8FU50_9FIRM|nr:hypothetical protein [Ruminococcus turbiniformis]MCC2253570.1 hypothetical protein [Ruminococcus turbiniformis]